MKQLSHCHLADRLIKEHLFCYYETDRLIEKVGIRMDKLQLT